MGKMKEYTKRAQARYNSKHKRLTVIITTDEHARMVAAGMTTADIKAIALAELARRESATDQEQITDGSRTDQE